MADVESVGQLNQNIGPVLAAFECLEHLSRARKPPFPQVDVGVEMDKNDWGLVTEVVHLVRFRSSLPHYCAGFPVDCISNSLSEPTPPDLHLPCPILRKKTRQNALKDLSTNHHPTQSNIRGDHRVRERGAYHPTPHTKSTRRFRSYQIDYVPTLPDCAVRTITECSHTSTPTARRRNPVGISEVGKGRGNPRMSP